MKNMDVAAIVLLLVGAFNWGLIAVFDFDLVGVLFESAAVARIIYGLFGLSGIYFLVNFRTMKDRWAKH